MIAPRPVLAEWIPLHGRMQRMPTAVSWRHRGPANAGVYDLVLLTIYGMEIIHSSDPKAPVPCLSSPEITHWLEGHPGGFADVSGPHYACKFCAALYGLKGADVPQLPDSPEVVAQHIAEVHQYPRRSARAILGDSPLRIKAADLIEATGAVWKIHTAEIDIPPLPPRRAPYWAICFSGAVAVYSLIAYMQALVSGHWVFACIQGVLVMLNVYMALLNLGIAKLPWIR